MFFFTLVAYELFADALYVAQRWRLEHGATELCFNCCPLAALDRENSSTSSEMVPPPPAKAEAVRFVHGAISARTHVY